MAAGKERPEITPESRRALTHDALTMAAKRARMDANGRDLYGPGFARRLDELAAEQAEIVFLADREARG